MDTPEVIKTQAKNEVTVLLTTLLKAQEKGDINLFSKCFVHSDDLINIGTDLDEYWLGWDMFSNHMKYMIELRKGLQITAIKTSIQVSESGCTAWYSQLIDTCIETKGDPFRLEGFRHTGVMEKINDQWKIVQSHTSVALDEPEESLAN